MNPAQVGKVLALVSPALAVGVVCFMLFATGYSYISMEQRVGLEGDPVEAASESGWMSAYEYSLENGDYAYFLWSGFIVVVCLLAAGAALKGWVGLVWAWAWLLGVLSILGVMSIGGMVAPLALVLYVSAFLSRASAPEGSWRPTSILCPPALDHYGLRRVWEPRTKRFWRPAEAFFNTLTSSRQHGE